MWVSFETFIDILQEIINLQNVKKSTCSQALGLVKNLHLYYIIVCSLFMKIIMYKTKILTEKFETTEFNIIDALMLSSLLDQTS